MNTLEYYEQYRSLCKRETLIEGQLQFFSSSPAADELCAELEQLRSTKNEIERNLANYIPYTLPPRSHYRALEEREFLFYRCVKGLTMMQTAELMCVSRDTVYRIRRRIAGHDSRFFTVVDDLDA